MTKTPNTTPQPNYPNQIIRDKAQPVEAVLFEHDDGRYAVNPNTTGDPAWHRLGPVQVYGLAPAAQPARQCVQQSEEPDALAEVSKEQYARMFGAACDALGQISDHLGIDSDINPGAEPIIEAIDELRAGAPAQAQTYPVLDGQWRRRMLDGAVLIRDAMGCGDHPALPALEEGMKPMEFFGALGIELVGVMAENQMDGDAYDAMAEAPDYNVWTPEAPAGEGWALVAIFDTEDGPAAWWMREAAPEQPARRNCKAAPAETQEDARDAERFRAMANAAISEDAAFGECLERLGGDCKTIADIRALFDVARAAQGGAA